MHMGRCSLYTQAYEHSFRRRIETLQLDHLEQRGPLTVIKYTFTCIGTIDFVSQEVMREFLEHISSLPPVVRRNSSHPGNLFKQAKLVIDVLLIRIGLCCPTEWPHSTTRAGRPQWSQGACATRPVPDLQTNTNKDSARWPCLQHNY